MSSIRRRLRLLAAVWLVVQAGSFSAFVASDCCAVHRAAPEQNGTSCHKPAEPAPCPMRATDGTPCPMHRAHDGGKEQAAACTMTGACNTPTATIFTALSTHAILPEAAGLLADPGIGIAATPDVAHLISRLGVPDTPPPRA